MNISVSAVLYAALLRHSVIWNQSLFLTFSCFYYPNLSPEYLNSCNNNYITNWFVCCVRYDPTDPGLSRNGWWVKSETGKDCFRKHSSSHLTNLPPCQSMQMHRKGLVWFNIFFLFWLRHHSMALWSMVRMLGLWSKRNRLRFIHSFIAKFVHKYEYTKWKNTEYNIKACLTSRYSINLVLKSNVCIRQLQSIVNIVYTAVWRHCTSSSSQHCQLH